MRRIWSLLSRKLGLLLVSLRLGSGLATHLHSSHSLSDVCNTRCTLLSPRRWVALSRRRVSAISRLLRCWLVLLSVKALAVLRVALCSHLWLLHLLLLLIRLSVAAVCGCRSASELLASALHLATYSGVGTRANVEGASSITSLLLLAGSSCVRLRGALLVGLRLIWLCVLARLAISSRF